MLGTVKMVGIMLLACSPIFIVVWQVPIQDMLDEVYDNAFIDVDYVGVVTDKWIRQETSFWVFGSTENYYVEVNDEIVESVDAFEYYNTEVGSYRNWTTTQTRKPFKAR